MKQPPTRFRFPRLFWLRDANTFDDELRHHLEMREAELRALGMSPDDAHAEALRQAGDVDDARGYVDRADATRVRSARWRLIADEVQHDFAFALRQMRKHFGFTTGSVLVLALGVAGFACAFGVANAYLMRGLPFPDADRIVAVRAGPGPEFFPRMPVLRTVDWQTVAPVFDATVAWDLDGFTIMGGPRPEYNDGAWVSPGYFDVLGVRTAFGRTFGASEYAGNARVALISHALWQTRFGGDSAAVGASVRMFSTDRPAEQEVVTIVGVLAPDAWYINRFIGVLRPLTVPRIPSLARLREGSSIETASAHLNAIVRPQVNEPDAAWRMSLASLHEEHVRSARPTILALLAGAALALLIACANVSGMAAVRGAQRRGEFAIRAALGAGRARLARQAFVESLTLTGIAAAAGLLIATWALTMGAAGIEDRLAVTAPGGVLLHVDWRIALGVVPVVLLVALFSAWRATRVQRGSLGDAVRPGASAGAGHARFRTALMAGQIALTFALLAGATLMARTAWNVTHVPLGFDTGGVFRADVLLPSSRFTDDAARTRATTEMVAAMAGRASVAAAAVAWPPPFRGAVPATVESDRAAAGDAPIDVRRVAVSPAYFEVLGIPRVAGRAFTERDDDAAAPVAVIGESLARRLWPAGNAVGSRIRFGDATGAATPWRTVVGVVRDTRHSLTENPLGEVYVPVAQAPRAYLTVLVRWRTPASPDVEGVAQAAAFVDESLALADAEPLAGMIDRESLRTRTLSALLAAFAAFGLVVAAIGLASTLAHAVAQRRAEFAVRLALGATPARMLRLVLMQTGAIVSIGLALGGALSVMIAGLLRSELHGVDAGDPAVYAAVLAIVVVVSFGAAAVPAVRAARVDPARALRG